MVLLDQVRKVKKIFCTDFHVVVSRIFLRNLVLGRRRAIVLRPGTSRRKFEDLNRYAWGAYFVNVYATILLEPLADEFGPYHDRYIPWVRNILVSFSQRNLVYLALSNKCQQATSCHVRLSPVCHTLCHLSANSKPQGSIIAY